MNVGKLIAEQLVVDLPGPIGLRKCLGDSAHFLHELDPLRRRQMEQFRRVALQDNDGPTGEKLIVMEIGFREPKIRDDMLGSGPDMLARFAGRISHGQLALRHSSFITTPFLINS